MGDFHALRVVKIKRETRRAVTIILRIPLLKKKLFNYQAGQYVNVRAVIHGVEVRRSYSLSDYPPKGNEIAFSVVEMPNGTMSSFLNNELMEGQSLEVSVPDGRFVFEPSEEHARKFVMIAAGSGITPILPHIKSILEVERRAQIVLLYGNSTKEDILFRTEIDRLQNEYSQLGVHHFVSREFVEERNFHHGRMSRGEVESILRAEIEHPAFGHYFLCGPEALMQTFLDYANDYNVPQINIFQEHFNAETVHSENIEGSVDCELTVILEEVEHQLIIPPKTFVLDALLDRGIDAPYSCQGGVCATCLAKVEVGEFNTDQNISLSRSDFDQGLILTCTSLALSKKARINFDEV